MTWNIVNIDNFVNDTKKRWRLRQMVDKVESIKVEPRHSNKPPPKTSFLKQMEMFYEKHNIQ